MNRRKGRELDGGRESRSAETDRRRGGYGHGHNPLPVMKNLPFRAHHAASRAGPGTDWRRRWRRRCVRVVRSAQWRRALCSRLVGAAPLGHNIRDGVQLLGVLLLGHGKGLLPHEAPHHLMTGNTRTGKKDRKNGAISDEWLRCAELLDDDIQCDPHWSATNQPEPEKRCWQCTEKSVR
jgi:hypothetical protein